MPYAVVPDEVSSFAWVNISSWLSLRCVYFFDILKYVFIPNKSWYLFKITVFLLKMCLYSFYFKN